MNDSVLEQGKVDTEIKEGIGRVTFYHPKSNSLPGQLLKSLEEAILTLSNNPQVKVILLKSAGEKAFCAGASFDEFRAVDSQSQAEEFFSGFARVIMAIKKAKCFVVCRVHGKVVGGGVGLVAASDYVLAVSGASIRLSELAIGIGPFTIGPAVQRKIGLSAFNELAIDAEWRSASWAKDKGLYNEVYSTAAELDQALGALLSKLCGYSPEAVSDLKRVLWEGTENWEELFKERVSLSGRLLLTDYVKNKIKEISAS
ncbi:MAG: enoyl-CoA hydratase/isomerase family protein [Candidatus Dadabacteria bacterium]|nr:MAG: enoyl-CoA hydratase/isomerase family protein [Candidatus Dadabacteria bacterium]